MNTKVLSSFIYSLFVFFILLCPLYVKSQNRSRAYIREQISVKNECRNVAITEHNGDLMLYGKNGWAATGCPQGLTDALDELNDDGEYIDDVQLTENGRWLILYGDNGIVWNDIPYSLEQKLREWNNCQEVISSVSFNDAGVWICVSKNYVSASHAEIQDWIGDGMEMFGAVWATCVTDDAIVVVYEKGFRTLGNIPNSLKDAINSTPINIYRLKIAGNAWFFSDGKSRFRYNM